MTRRAPGPFQIKAAIAACHMAEEKPDWPQIAALYDSLLRFEPAAVVRLNRAVAYSEAQSARLGLRLIEDLSEELVHYQPYHAAKAALLARDGKVALAVCAFDKAISMANSSADIAFLTRKRDELTAGANQASGS